MSLATNFDHKESTPLFFGLCFASVTLGLLIGGCIDSVVRKAQREDDDWSARDFRRAVAFFILQVAINITLLLCLTKASDQFVPWLQLSVAGALFAVLLFAGQRNLANNVLRITRF